MLDKVNGHNDTIKTNGVGNSNTSTNGQNGTGEVRNGNGHYSCEHHNIKTLTVKKEGANKGRRFETCNDCRAFLGFV